MSFAVIYWEYNRPPTKESARRRGRTEVDLIGLFKLDEYVRLIVPGVPICTSPRVTYMFRK